MIQTNYINYLICLRINIIFQFPFNFLFYIYIQEHIIIAVSAMTDTQIKRKADRPDVFTEEEQIEKVKAHYRLYYQGNTEQTKCKIMLY